MPEVPPLPVETERTAQVVSAAIVALVVLVLGFGSGIGAVFERSSSGPAAAPVATTTPGATTGVGATVTPGAIPDVAGGTTLTTRRSSAASSSTTTATTVLQAATIPTAATTPTTATTVTPACPGAAAAMVTPLWAHLRSAHLETAVGDQVADALDVDDYVAAHTALVGMVLDGLRGVVDTLWAHLRAAHLWSSPGQQVADLLQVDDYVLAHTVLVEDMARGVVGDLAGGGRC